MCGIHAFISTKQYQTPTKDLLRLLCSRGPDYTGSLNTRVGSEESDRTECFLSFTSTVLALRGGHITSQPFIDKQSGSILCWNGEAWKFGTETVTGNDGQAIFSALIEAVRVQDDCDSKTRVLEVLNAISGPFALVFLDKKRRRVYFSRDRLGRRSLLFNATQTSLELSSISEPGHGNWQEVEADGIYILSCSKRNAEELEDQIPSKSAFPLQRHAWGANGSSEASLGTFNRCVPDDYEILNSQSQSVATLRLHLRESLRLRVLNIPAPPGLDTTHNSRVAVLFSGGLDCTVLARMIHDLLPAEDHIDLINVAFENPRVIQAARNASKSTQTRKQGAPEKTYTAEEGISAYEACPDRETGRKAFQELIQVCPTRTWRFVAVNVAYTETVAHRAKVVDLISPHNTEMDLSIAFALHFAARGSGIASTSVDTSSEMYNTPARVLISGLGADELFGGYTRHATAFSRRGFAGLIDELELDVNRLGKRNLGRDDRVISHWGREARFPFLDESLVRWAVECPISAKCGFRTIPDTKKEMPDIEPGKKVLRLLAFELGLHSVAYEKKRAIQFGARTAKMEIGNTKGTALIA